MYLSSGWRPLDLVETQLPEAPALLPSSGSGELTDIRNKRISLTQPCQPAFRNPRKKKSVLASSSVVAAEIFPSEARAFAFSPQKEEGLRGLNLGCDLRRRQGSSFSEGE